MFPGEDFDNIDVDLDVDINHKDKKKGISDDFEEDYLQDDIPIDDDDDDDDMISDNYKAHVATLDGMPNDAELKDVFHLERI